ncbi:GntR family transcriptional regulator [Nocardia sp. NBC_00565]|uniref:GntR family transcriptional regulator n=1 Tax=Nocardia sp. NBC_00565 TaxID=2975993 RepID=UPI002E815F0C|nr:GntR family transcriptional regulator [Nocardia sp. NBC_00565]WUC07249.1 GntR family transcriptional regulator [Nocardia sp. NBC_00565]
MPALLDIAIDRSSPVPLYFQLAQAIENSILEGRLTPGDRIENELDLAKRLNLSRPTARQAIQALVDKGLLTRRRGVGTQVVQNQVHRPVELTSLYDDLISAGQEPTTELLDYQLGSPDADIAAELGVPADSRFVTFRRLRRAGSEPLAIMTNYVPAEFAPAPDQLEARGFYECLRAKGVHIALARQRIGARSATRAEAQLLDERPNAPLLTMQRVAFDDSGRPVELGRHVYRASRHFFDTTVRQ